MKNKAIKISIFCAAIALPLSLMVGNLVGLILKNNNPSNIDITADLAYLKPILISSYLTFGLMCLIAAISGILSLRGEHKNQAKLSLIMLFVILLSCLVAGVAQKQTQSVESNYSKSQIIDLYKQFNIKESKVFK